jgi:hypothetical protein
MDLPVLNPKQLNPTRDYLQDAAHAIGSLQRGFMAKQPHDWQYGLEVTMRGIGTQPFAVDDKETRVLLDIVRRQIRLDDANWPLEEYDGSQLFNNFKVWLESKGVKAELQPPPFKGGSFDAEQAKKYFEALWWLRGQFQIVKAELLNGSTSPILLYPHHFDMAMSWFPHDDDRQMTLGFSTGDETIAEPYIYLTVYPEPADFGELMSQAFSPEFHWQENGFSGAVLPYSKLQSHENPQDLFTQFVGQLSSYAVANGF